MIAAAPQGKEPMADVPLATLQHVHYRSGNAFSSTSLEVLPSGRSVLAIHTDFALSPRCRDLTDPERAELARLVKQFPTGRKVAAPSEARTPAGPAQTVVTVVEVTYRLQRYDKTRYCVDTLEKPTGEFEVAADSAPAVKQMEEHLRTLVERAEREGQKCPADDRMAEVSVEVGKPLSLGGVRTTLREVQRAYVVVEGPAGKKMRVDVWEAEPEK